MIQTIINYHKYKDYMGEFATMGFWEFRRLEKHTNKEKKLQKTCKHEGYTFKEHGRCCPHCGMFLTDFGD